mmetsp:Transcript_161350/g.512694  ORF Transcript_161350/g.512694 Transcript_161350/m.512694 type:complete len:98 (+) Transcript_161350:63-356(+)
MTAACSVHGKVRSEGNMTDDGNGGWMCAPGYECQTGGGAGKSGGKGKCGGGWSGGGWRYRLVCDGGRVDWRLCHGNRCCRRCCWRKPCSQTTACFLL